MARRWVVFVAAAIAVAHARPIAQADALFSFHSNPWLNLHHILCLKGNGAPLPYTETTINNYHIIGQGQATNMDLKETTHVTVDANGNVSASVADYTFVCHGTETF